MNKTVIAIATLLLSLGVATSAHAAGNSRCQVIYGGGEVCEKDIKFTLNKLVKRPGGDFVENLNVNDPKYSASQNVDFKVVIENTGNSKIDNATITDTFPQYLTFVSGNGNYDQNSRKLTFNVTNLEKGQKQEFVITARVVEDKLLPQDQTAVCVNNQVTARETNGATASDSSQVCIERHIVGAKPTPQVFESVPVKKIPETGPEALSLIALVPAGLAGLALRKKKFN